MPAVGLAASVSMQNASSITPRTVQVCAGPAPATMTAAWPPSSSIHALAFGQTCAAGSGAAQTDQWKTALSASAAVTSPPDHSVNPRSE